MKKRTSKEFRKLMKNKVEQSKEKKSMLVAVRLPIDVYDEMKSTCEETNATTTQVVVEALRKAFGLNA